jgi:hypothetical protein
MAGTVIADAVQAASTSQLVIKNGVALTPPTINDVNGTQIGTFCRAWVNFNGTGTVAIRASFNVSSITDNGTGDYTVNFTNAMPDVNYVANGAAASTNNTNFVVIEFDSNAIATTSIRLSSGFSTTKADSDYVYVSIFR